MDDNRRMIQDTTRASLTLLYNISRELASISDLRTMLARVLTLSVPTVGAERGSILVLDAAGRAVDAALVYRDQVLSGTVEQLKITLDKGLAGWVYRRRQPVLVRDTSKDERWLRRPDDAVEQSGAKSAICVPLVEREQLLGILTIVHPVPNFFNEEHLALVQAIGDQAGIAVRNAQLYSSLEESRRRYYDLFEDSVDPIFITDADGNILDANRQAEQATGFPVETLKSRSIFDLHEPRREKLGDGLSNLEGEQAVLYESSLQSKSGKAIPVEIHVRRVNFEVGQNLQWIVRDITERKDLETMQEDLSSMIYHDLRSPLSNVFSSLEMIETMLAEGSSPALNTVVKIAMRSTERVQRLTNSLLDIRRLEAGQPILTRRAIEVVRLMEDARDFIQQVADTKQQHVILELVGSYPDILVDGDMIRRVLVNLLENACKFTPVGGTISTGARAQGSEVLFWVHDTGKGMPPEVLEKIFDKFISLQSENMPRGLGLGLAFCRLAIQAHSGSIWAESQEGEGSTFFFKLPAAPGA